LWLVYVCAFTEIQRGVALLKEQKLNAVKEKKGRTTAKVDTAQTSAPYHASSAIGTREKQQDCSEASFAHSNKKMQKKVEAGQADSVPRQVNETVENPVEAHTAFQTTIKMIKNCKSYMASIVKWKKQPETQPIDRK
jgi:hypothetical protein